MKKFFKKLWTKLAGITKYLVYMGKIVQVLKIVSTVMPQIALMVKPEQKETLTELAEVLSNITGKLETTEKYLNEMGVATDTASLQKRAGENVTPKRAVRMLEKIDAEMA